MKRPRTTSAVLAAVLLAVSLAPPARAERLPVRTYGVQDGLAHSRVNEIFQDARGWLWICTWEGISRSDGREFVNYGTRDGLSNPLVNAVAADPAGRLWFATHADGVARFEDRRTDMTAPKFTMFRVDSSRTSNVVYGLFFTADSTLWCSTQAGIYRARLDAGSVPRFQLWRSSGGEAVAFPLDMERRTVAIVDSTSVWRVTASGEERWPLIAPLAHPDFTRVAADRDGGLFFALTEKLYQFTPPAADSASASASPPSGDRPAAGTWQRIPLDLTPDRYITTIFRDATGVLWIGTRDGLLKLANGEVVRYSRAEGLSDSWIRTIAEDRDGNLWIGTQAGGLDRLSRQGIVTFGLTEGLLDPNVVHIVESHDGRIYASTSRGGVVEVRGRELRQIPGSESPPFRRTSMHIRQDRAGDWWIGADVGLYRFDGPELQLRRGHRFGRADGIPDSVALFGDIHEDRSGRIWFGVFEDGIYRYDPATTPRVTHFDLARAGDAVPRTFIDRPGGVLFGPFVGLWQIIDDHLAPFTPQEGVPSRDPDPRTFFRDHRGRLWIGFRFHGVSVTDDPWVDHPVFRNYSMRDGLASDAVWAISEDRSGRMYFGTARGVDRLDPDTGRIRHIGAEDGLVGDVVSSLHRDANGYIWVGSSGGITRIDPAAMHAGGGPPPVFILRVESGGEELPVPETGSVRAGEFRLPAANNNVLIAFDGIDFRGPPLLYQWMLAGVDHTWSRPMNLRSVQYARLAAGNYRFMVRAVNVDGEVSPVPAEVLFRVLRPVWAQPWFVAMIGALVVGVAYAFHRVRVERALVLERIRRQIATDLHDDVGSGLSQIAVLSEVGKRDAADPALRGTLDEMATLARAMRDSMSDIVWSVDPRKDHLSDLVQRMRQVALNLLDSGGVTVEFAAPPDADFERINLAPDRRRHLHLIFKESVTNIARHAGASRVKVEIRVSGGTLDMVVEDDGRGFAAAGVSGGQGLASMQERAEALGGRIVVRATPGRGTRLHLSVPLR